MNEIPAVEPAPVMAETELPDNHPGVDDGFVDELGEKVVHEYDEDGQLIGWHKEPIVKGATE